MKAAIAILMLVFVTPLVGCGVGDYKNYLRMHNIPAPKTDSFTHCYDYGCKTQAIVTLPTKTEKKLRKQFKHSAKTASDERKKIAKAIAILEKDIGHIVGTKNDKFGTFRMYQDDAETTTKFQQDCIDESTNTTIYLGLLEEMAVLKFHRPVFPATRQPFSGGGLWWHQSATMQEIDTGERFAVDSWFRDNGYPPFIVTLEEWKQGWRPPKI